MSFAVNEIFVARVRILFDKDADSTTHPSGSYS